MPREYSHFLACKRAFDKKQIAGILIEDNLLPYFYLGSISPDSGYYAPRGEEFSNYIHSGFNSYADNIFFELLSSAESKQISREEREKLIAFAIGFYSHVHLDINVHKVVDRIAGNYDDLNPILRKAARTKHRRLETILDSYLILNNPSSDLILPRLIKILGTDIKFLSECFVSSVAKVSNNTIQRSSADYLNYLKWHSGIVATFSNSLFCSVPGVSKVFPSEVSALFSNVKDFEYDAVFESVGESGASELSVSSAYDSAVETLEATVQNKVQCK